MKTLTLVVSDWDNQVELLGAFESELEAVKHVWSQIADTMASFRPIGGDRERAEDRIVRENMVKLQLRPCELSQPLAGLGPASIRRVWLEQNGWEADHIFTLVTLQAADVPSSAVPQGGWGNLVRIQGRGGQIYTHRESALGQQIIEHVRKRVAETGEEKELRELSVLCPDCSASKVPGAFILDGLAAKCADCEILTPTFSAKELLDHAHGKCELEGLCEACKASRVPGVLFPFQPDGLRDLAYAQACDECKVYVDDMAAAVALAHVIKRPLGLSEGLPYIQGVTQSEAYALGRR